MDYIDSTKQKTSVLTLLLSSRAFKTRAKKKSYCTFKLPLRRSPDDTNDKVLREWNSGISTRQKSTQDVVFSACCIPVERKTCKWLWGATSGRKALIWRQSRGEIRRGMESGLWSWMEYESRWCGLSYAWISRRVALYQRVSGCL